MRIDLDYMKALLVPFLESENAHITAQDWESAGITIKEQGKMNEKFLFHLTLLVENGLISNDALESYDLESVGVISYLSGEKAMAIRPLRLTQNGHDFATILENSEALQRLKSDFKNMTFDVIFDTGKTLMSAFAKKKLNDLGLI
ncbi:DUF2513 domain-containing protein [Vibrio mediterranei]|uniref:DUF2513 domain-containing protein n=1 Tax=Vibrio mediterranei TaxID=689 RepID=A0A3G4V501_9VIBR|nr:DUF2513 domain-containing protein [Vibrio mediterranei]AYV19835.1 DUF2513 domain-containing protein [Vibrio mediterranei]AYV19843.1 DUF2513 domain-containing protein [Vibrio mediterranei]